MFVPLLWSLVIRLQFLTMPHKQAFHVVDEPITLPVSLVLLSAHFFLFGSFVFSNILGGIFQSLCTEMKYKKEKKIKVKGLPWQYSG